MHKVDLPITHMFRDVLDYLEHKAVYTKSMWLKQVRCPINDWLRENVQGHYEIWENYDPVMDIVHGLHNGPVADENGPVLSFRFEEPGDAMRFKLTWL